MFFAGDKTSQRAKQVIAAELLTGIRYIKLGFLEGAVEISRRILRGVRLRMYETKKDLGILPPASEFVYEIIHDAGEEEYDCHCDRCT